MTVQPQVDLLFDPRDLTDAARLNLEANALSQDSVRGSLERALMMAHTNMIIEARKRLELEPDLNPAVVGRVLDLTWRMFLPRFIRVAWPPIATAYGDALVRARAGDVPEAYVRNLAEAHAERLGQYFHETSRDAMLEGFNTYVNRRMPLRAALDRALAAYGLSKRQMGGYTSNLSLESKVSSRQSRRVQAARNDYISKSLAQRFGAFAAQEEHNLEQQAEQLTWMWLVDHDQVPDVAEKIWITAKDEKVCPNCGPMHGKVVKVNERFVLPNGVKVWVPGPHPNCRCKAHFRVPRQLEVVKALQGNQRHTFNREHPRDEEGRFSAKARTGPRFKEREPLTLQLPEIEVKEKPPEPVISLRGEKLESPEKKISLKEKRVSLVPRAISLRDQEQVVSLRQDQGRISLKPEEERLSLRERFDRVAEQKRVARQISLVGEKIQREPVKQKFLYMNTMQLAEPAYRVVNPSTGEEMDQGGRITFNHTQHWTTDPAEASRAAVAWRREAVDAAIKRLKIDPTKDYTPDVQSPLRGAELYMTLTETQIEDVVAWAASQNYPNEQSRLENKMTSVTLYAPHGEALAGFPSPDVPSGEDDEWWERRPFTMKELANLYEIEPAEFNMAVAVINRGHNSELGRTDVRPGDRNSDVVTVSGDFVVDSSHEGSAIVGNENAPEITFYHLEPADVEQMLIERDLEDDE